MSGRVTNLWRHPIKSHGREALSEVTLAPGQTIPWDRRWAVTHESTRFDGSGWAPCQNFMLGTRTAGLAGLWARVDEAAARVTLTHASLGKFSFCPDDEGEAANFLDWVRPLCPEGRSMPKAVVSVPGRGMTDTDYPSVSVMNMSSHRAVSQKLGRDLEHERWRGNIWLDGLAPWEEVDWIGHRVRIGPTVLDIRDPIERCLHTASNPRTGQRDADTLGALRTWGHQDFGVYAQVVEGGTIRVGDEADLA